MNKDELIKYYENELLYNSRQEQSNIKDRNYTLSQKYKDWNTIILQFIDDLKNLNVETVKRKELIDFIQWNNQHNGIAQPVSEKMADHYLKSINE